MAALGFDRGRNPMDHDNIFVVTGDSGMGITHGTIAGMLLTDLILGRTNPWEALYDPSRVRLGAAADFARENSNVALQYTDWLTGGDVASAEDVRPGTGAIVRRGLEKIAVYRDDAGRHERERTEGTRGGEVRERSGRAGIVPPARTATGARRGRPVRPRR